MPVAAANEIDQPLEALVEEKARRIVPEAAIVPRGEDKIVYLVKDGQAIEAKVTLGNRNKGMVEILDGLADDAMVVTAGQQKLRNGSPVEIVIGANPGARGT